MKFVYPTSPFLKDKLSRFPKQENKLFMQICRQEALKLAEEPNGKKLLSLIGGIYISEAEAYINMSSNEGKTLIKWVIFLIGKKMLIKGGYFFDWAKWFLDLISASMERENDEKVENSFNSFTSIKTLYISRCN